MKELRITNPKVALSLRGTKQSPKQSELRIKKSNHYCRFFILNVLAAAFLLSLTTSLHGQGDCTAPPDPLPGLLDRLTPNQRLLFARQQVDSKYLHKIRVVYFVPQDQPNRIREVKDQIQQNIGDTLAFFADQRSKLNFGTKSLEIVRDTDGSFEIQTIIGKHNHAYYESSGWASSTEKEIDERFIMGELDLDTHHSLVVLFIEKDTPDVDGAGGKGGNRNPEGGVVWLPAKDLDSKTTAHEIGHALGLDHNFNSPLFIMSYGGRRRDRLAPVYGRFLNSSRYFNNFSSPSNARNTLIEIVEPFPLKYDARTDKTGLIFGVHDPDGVAQMLFMPTTGDVHSITKGAPEMYWNGEGLGDGQSDVPFRVDFFADAPPDNPLPLEKGGDGINPIWQENGVPQQRHRERVPGVSHEIGVMVIDTGGFITRRSFFLLEEQTENRVLIVRSDSSSEYSTVEEALREAITGDTIEIQDNGTFERLYLRTDGIILRGGADFSPKIRGVTIDGVREVFIENLTVVDNRFAAQNGAEVTLRNVTVTGLLEGQNSAYAIFESSVTMEKCNASENYRGLWIGENSFVTVIDSTFANNKSSISVSGGTLSMQGGTITDSEEYGLYVRCSKGFVPVVTIEGTTFERIKGEGIFADCANCSLKNVKIRECEFGVVITNSQSSDPVVLDNCIIESNEKDGVSCTESGVSLINTHIAKNGRHGIVAENSTLSLSNISIEENTETGVLILNSSVAADQLLSKGNKTGLWFQDISDPQINLITNAIVVKNKDLGIYLYNAAVRFLNITLAYNESYGFGVTNASRAFVANSILWQNGDLDLYIDGNSTAEVDYSLLTKEGKFPGEGRIQGDPLFVEPVNGDYQLREDSPALNAGSSSVEGFPSHDFLGKPRVVDNEVDLGALEHQVDSGSTIVTPWDVDKNGIVDISDLSIVGINFGAEIPPETALNPDVNRDGVVDISDLVLVGRHFEEQD